MAASLSESQSFFRAQRGSTRVNEDKRHTFFDCGVAGSCSSGVELRLRDATYNATTCFVELHWCRAGGARKVRTDKDGSTFLYVCVFDR